MRLEKLYSLNVLGEAYFVVKVLFVPLWKKPSRRVLMCTGYINIAISYSSGIINLFPFRNSRGLLFISNGDASKYCLTISVAYVDGVVKDVIFDIFLSK